mmetsp:Transcript_171171/g.548685  ORF Transcript_171171/g.548685 Transcript_171171/m.548685 type:complete len:90 (+) Transcript_171171:222-491(+)
MCRTPLSRKNSVVYVVAVTSIIMVDVTSRIRYKDSDPQNVPNLHRDIVCVCENVPAGFVGNKVGRAGGQAGRQISYPSAHTRIELLADS